MPPLLLRSRSDGQPLSLEKALSGPSPTRSRSEARPPVPGGGAARKGLAGEAELPSGRCMVCLEEKSGRELGASEEVCGSGRCGGCCGGCLRRYFEERVSASGFALPRMACISCRGRLPARRWRACVAEATFAEYEQKARDLLTVRCPGCDGFWSLATDSLGPWSCGSALLAFGERCRDCASVRRAWWRFEAGQADAETFLDVLTADGPRDLRDCRPERRIAEDGRPYKHQYFVQWYGHVRAQEEWLRAEVYSLATRTARDGRDYTLAEFREWFGQEGGQNRWDGAPLAGVSEVLALIADVERRTALHLAFLRRWPKIRTPCCNVKYCFKCQVGSWHEQQSCEEILAEEAQVEVQFCPGCGVPTQRTEGCSSMVCLCGMDWTWRDENEEEW